MDVEKLPNGLTKREHFALEIYKSMIVTGVHKYGSDDGILRLAIRRAENILQLLGTNRGR